MSALFSLRILAADHTFYEGECLSLVVPLSEGLYGIQAHHTPLVGAMVPGKLKYTLPDGEEHIAAVSSGLVRVENNEVLVLTESAERPEEIDAARARRDAQLAEEELRQSRSRLEHSDAEIRIARALNRLRVRDEGFNN